MVTKFLFDTTAEGKQVYAYEIKNCKGESVNILELGGIVQSLKILNRSGGLVDVALGFDDVAGYQNNGGYLGALIGRYANRIAKGKFSLNGKNYKLFKNNGNNHLHGGKKGYDSKIWQANICGDKLELTLFSPDGDEGYPADLDIKVTYYFDDESIFGIEYYATSSDDTIINLTNHCYFNLNGEGCGNILSHIIKINSKEYTPADCESIPTGEIKSVDGTPFDFREFKTIGRDINCPDEQLILGKGYDHNYVLGEGYKKACEVYSEVSGIAMEVLTDSEGMQFYSGNYLNAKGKGGKAYNSRYGFCLETQHYPDSPNKPQFPSCILKKGDVYRHKTVFKFGIK